MAPPCSPWNQSTPAVTPRDTQAKLRNCGLGMMIAFFFFFFFSVERERWFSWLDTGYASCEPRVKLINPALHSLHFTMGITGSGFDVWVWG